VYRLVIGCKRADLPDVAGAKVKMASDGKTAVVQCDVQQVRWALNCVSDKWIGNIGNCSASAVADGSNRQLHFASPCHTMLPAVPALRVGSGSYLREEPERVAARLPTIA